MEITDDTETESPPKKWLIAIGLSFLGHQIVSKEVENQVVLQMIRASWFSFEMCTLECLLATGFKAMMSNDVPEQEALNA